MNRLPDIDTASDRAFERAVVDVAPVIALPHARIRPKAISFGAVIVVFGFVRDARGDMLEYQQHVTTTSSE